MAIIVCPTPYYGVEVTNYPRGRLLPMTSQVFRDFADVDPHLLLLRNHKHFSGLVSDMEAQKVKALVDVNDFGLRLIELQSSRRKKLFQRWADMLFRDFSGGAEHNEVVGIAT